MTEFTINAIWTLFGYDHGLLLLRCRDSDISVRGHCIDPESNYLIDSLLGQDFLSFIERVRPDLVQRWIWVYHQLAQINTSYDYVDVPDEVEREISTLLSEIGVIYDDMTWPESGWDA